MTTRIWSEKPTLYPRGRSHRSAGHNRESTRNAAIRAGELTGKINKGAAQADDRA